MRVSAVQAAGKDLRNHIFTNYMLERQLEGIVSNTIAMPVWHRLTSTGFNFPPNRLEDPANPFTWSSSEECEVPELAGCKKAQELAEQPSKMKPRPTDAPRLSQKHYAEYLRRISHFITAPEQIKLLKYVNLLVRAVRAGDEREKKVYQ